MSIPIRDLLQKNFDFLVVKDNKFSFLENENNMFDVLEFIYKNKISLTKIEKLEPTLESLFLEVTK